MCVCVCARVCVSRWPGDVSIQMKNYKLDKSDIVSLYNNQVKAKLTVKDYDQNRLTIGLNPIFSEERKFCIKINAI